MKEGRAWSSCLGWVRGHGVARMEAKGKHYHLLKAWLEWCRLEVCVSLRNFTLEAFPWKLEELLLKNNTLKNFTHKNFTFIEGRRVKSKFPSFPLFLAFSHYLCARLAGATGFSFSVGSSRVYSKVLSRYLNPIFTHSGIKRLLIWAQILTKVDFWNLSSEMTEF